MTGLTREQTQDLGWNPLIRYRMVDRPELTDEGRDAIWAAVGEQFLEAVRAPTFCILPVVRSRLDLFRLAYQLVRRGLSRDWKRGARYYPNKSWWNA